MATNITDRHQALFDALTGGIDGEFCRFSSFVDGQPAAAICTLDFHQSATGQADDQLAITPLLVSFTPAMAIAVHDGQEPPPQGPKDPEQPSTETPTPAPTPGAAKSRAGLFHVNHLAEPIPPTASPETPMPDTQTISADYTLRPSELAETLALLVEARQPCIVWGPPGSAKSQIAYQVAQTLSRNYVDIRALLLDPVDLRGIPWRDSDGRTRWAPPVFLPPTDDPGKWLLNLEELAACLPMVQAALYQLVLERKLGEYELPDGASIIACSNRESDRAIVHRMPTALASRFVHLEIRVHQEDWCTWAASSGIAPEVLFFIQMRPDLLHDFNPDSAEKAFPCPRTWEFVSNIVNQRASLDPSIERALYRGTVGEAAAVDFTAFLRVWREMPHPRAVIDDPENADIPDNTMALIALCGALYRMANDINVGSIVTYAKRLRNEIGEFLVSSCVRNQPDLQRSDAFIRWAAHTTQ